MRGRQEEEEHLACEGHRQVKSREGLLSMMMMMMMRGRRRMMPRRWIPSDEVGWWPACP